MALNLPEVTPHLSLCSPPQVISTARTCDLIFIVLDCLKPLTHKRIIERELEGFGIRLNKKAPNITFKWDRGCGRRGMMSLCPFLLSPVLLIPCLPYPLPSLSSVLLIPCPLYRRKDKGGISFSTTATNPKIDLDAVKAVCAEYRINNADILCTGM